MRANRGFTLLELLVVLAIMAILLSIFVSSFRWNATQQFENSVNGVQNFLALAQTQAVARNTFVWVGFINTTGPTGLPELAGAAVYSPDGTSTVASTSLLPLTPIYRWQNVLLTNDAAVNSKVQALLPTEANTTTATISLLDAGTTPEVFPNLTQAPFNPAPIGVNFHTVTFTPQGEAMLTAQPAAPPAAPTGYEAAIDFGLRRTVGSGPIATNPDDIVLRLYGGSGKIREFRLQ